LAVPSKPTAGKKGLPAPSVSTEQFTSYKFALLHADTGRNSTTVASALQLYYIISTRHFN